MSRTCFGQTFGSHSWSLPRLLDSRSAGTALRKPAYLGLFQLWASASRLFPAGCGVNPLRSSNPINGQEQISSKETSLPRLRHDFLKGAQYFDADMDASSCLRSCTAHLVQFHDTCRVSECPCPRKIELAPETSGLASRDALGQRRVAQCAACRVSRPETSGAHLSRKEPLQKYLLPNRSPVAPKVARGVFLLFGAAYQPSAQKEERRLCTTMPFSMPLMLTSVPATSWGSVLGAALSASSEAGYSAGESRRGRRP